VRRRSQKTRRPAKIGGLSIAEYMARDARVDRSMQRRDDAEDSKPVSGEDDRG